jgi:NADPH-dependent 2,4-dienoyl-CoA reductase/sulfur reductase-like enzyme/rhodanese-related sulfurtransferase
MKVLVIGGVAAGPKIAAKVKREMPSAEVTVIQKGKYLSYAGCGLPYYIGGVFADRDELISTPTGTHRDISFFKKVKGLTVRINTEAVKIDREKKQVLVVCDGKEEWLPYDKLALATGAEPFVPPSLKNSFDNVSTLQTVEEGDRIFEALASGNIRNVAIVGGGYIGVEMAEALLLRKCNVTIVEREENILTIIDPELAMLTRNYMEEMGIKIFTNTTVSGFITRPGDPSCASGLETDKGKIQADYILVVVGVRPRAELAKDAGLQIGKFGGIKVDATMQTSDPDIYAAGDCVECTNMVTGKPAYVPLGSTANKAGRIAALNIVGKKATFPGVVCSGVCQIVNYTVARTGLTEKQAKAAGFDVVSVLVSGPDRPHFMPGMAAVFMKLIGDKSTGRLLGVQAVGPGDCEKRVSIAATAISASMTVADVANLDLCYAPPYTPAVDNLLTGANVLLNKMDGMMESISPVEVEKRIEDGEDLFLLDVRSKEEFAHMALSGSTLVPLGQIDERMDEVPKDKPVIVYCKLSLRGYEAAVKLRAKGYKNVQVMEGGLLMWPFSRGLSIK